MRLKFVGFAIVVCMLAGSAFGQATTVHGDTGLWLTGRYTNNAPSKVVQPLTDVEKAALTAARKKLEAAQEELSTVEISVKAAHGEYHSSCGGYEASVTFFGDYALIDTALVTGCTAVQMNTLPTITYGTITAP